MRRRGQSSCRWGDCPRGNIPRGAAWSPRVNNLSSQSPHTRYPEVNALLDCLLAMQREALGSQFVGLYLFGSLSWGDFDPTSSDVDFLSVTEGALDADAVSRLDRLHRELAASGSPWAAKLEGSYIPRGALWRYDPADAVHQTIGVDWPFGLARHRENWIVERHIVRERGRAIAGPPPKSLIDVVTPDQLREAVRAGLDTFWSQQLADPTWLRPLNYQAFAILTMCRALYTLRTGDVASKPEAARWALRELPEPWAATVARALATRADPRPGDLGATLDFIRYAIARGTAREQCPGE